MRRKTINVLHGGEEIEVLIFQHDFFEMDEPLAVCAQFWKNDRIYYSNKLFSTDEECLNYIAEYSVDDASDLIVRSLKKTF